MITFVGLRTRTINLLPSSGKSCPRPGEVPHGRWTCEVEDTPIVGTSFLDGEAQTYPGSEFDICAKKLHFYFQLFNAVYTVNLAMSLIENLWLHVLTGATSQQSLPRLSVNLRLRSSSPILGRWRCSPTSAPWPWRTFLTSPAMVARGVCLTIRLSS